MQQVIVQFIVIFDITFLFALFDLVERWLGNVNITALYEFRHLAIEECQQQGTNMRAIDVRIGHDNDAVITHFVGIVFFLAYATSEGRYQGAYFGRR